MVWPTTIVETFGMHQHIEDYNLGDFEFRSTPNWWIYRADQRESGFTMGNLQLIQWVTYPHLSLENGPEAAPNQTSWPKIEEPCQLKWKTFTKQRFSSESSFSLESLLIIHLLFSVVLAYLARVFSSFLHCNMCSREVRFHLSFSSF